MECNQLCLYLFRYFIVNQHNFGLFWLKNSLLFHKIIFTNSSLYLLKLEKFNLLEKESYMKEVQKNIAIKKYTLDFVLNNKKNNQKNLQISKQKKIILIFHNH